MERKPLISIIIPCYNDSQFVMQSVNSALNQTYSNIEVIVVDDGSDSMTKIILKELEPKITKLITQANQGQSTARNVGIKEAKGEYILLLDSDDYLEPSLCDKAISIFLSHEKIKIVSCYANLIYENSNTIVYKPAGGTIKDFLFCNAALGTSMFKKVDWLSSGGYDEQMRDGFEDWEFFIRLLQDDGFAEILQESLYNYRKRNHSTTSVANSNKFELLKYIFKKHQDLYVQHYELLIGNLLSKIENEEREKLKNFQRIEYRIGKLVLCPLRKIKSLFK